jgi:hypothetical protein
MTEAISEQVTSLPGNTEDNYQGRGLLLRQPPDLLVSIIHLLRDLQLTSVSSSPLCISPALAR